MPSYLCILISGEGSVLDSAWISANDHHAAHDLALSFCDAREGAEGYELVIDGHAVGTWGRKYVIQNRRKC